MYQYNPDSCSGIMLKIMFYPYSYLYRIVLAGVILFCLLPFNAFSEETDRVFRVGFAQDTMANDWREAQVRQMKSALEPYAFVEFSYTDAKGKPLRQLLDLQTLDKQGVDILVTSPRDQKMMTPVITALHKRKPVILLTRKTLSDDFTSFIGPDDTKIAKNAAKLIAEKLNGKGRIIMLTGVETATTSKARSEGFLKEIENYPDIEIVASVSGNYRRSRAYVEMNSLLQQKTAFDALYAHSDSMASGARMAMRENGLEPANYIIVGIDFIPEAKEAIQTGQQTASFTYPTAGREGAEIILKLIHGEKVEKYVDVPSVMVTAENVDEVDTIFD